MSVPRVFRTVKNRGCSECSDPLVKEWRNTCQAEGASLEAARPSKRLGLQVTQNGRPS